MQYVKPFSEPFVNADKHLKGADIMSYDLGLDSVERHLKVP